MIHSLKALGAKVKRLKALLTKSGNVNKEKDAEISLLKRREAEFREDTWTSFRVLMRVEDDQNSSGMSAKTSSQSHTPDIWCLIGNASTSMASSDTSVRKCQSKWILESDMLTSIQENATSLVNDIPEHTLQQLYEQKIKEQEEAHLISVNNLRDEIVVVTQNFQAYKVRQCRHTNIRV